MPIYLTSLYYYSLLSAVSLKVCGAPSGLLRITFVTVDAAVAKAMRSTHLLRIAYGRISDTE